VKEVMEAKEVKDSETHHWSPVEEELLIRLILGSKAYGTDYSG